MANQIVKKISAPYLLVATNGEPTQFTVGKESTMNAVLTINGNLNVLGTQTSISTIDTEIQDNIITLNAGLPPTSSPVGLLSGLSINRGNGDVGNPGGFAGTAQLVWNETAKKWQLTNDGTTFQNIATAGASGNYISDVVEDLTPQLGGDLDINGFSITSIANNIIIAPSAHAQIDAPLQLKEITTPAPSAIPGYGIVYASDVMGGGTGLYSTHATETDEELISKKKAILYSLIF